MASIDDIIKTKFPNEKSRMIANMIYTSNWIQNNFNEFLKPFKLSSQQFNILRILRGNGSWMSMNDIKGVMIEKAPNATRLSDKLLEKELVDRKRSESDRRIVYLKITKQGLEMLSKIDEADNEIFGEFLDKIKEKKAKKFSDFLDEIRP